MRQLLLGSAAPLSRYSGVTVQEPDSIVPLLAWIVLGLISGFIASKIISRRGESFVLDIVLGVVGAVLGGTLFSPFGMGGINGLNPYCFFVAITGAIAVFVAYHFWFVARADRV